jgi:ribosome-binding protein aMBF1 (putative translation factor)
MSATAEFDMKEFGHRLHTVARWKGLSNEALAVELKIHPESIARHMRGKTIPNVVQLDRYIRFLGISVESLMNHAEPLVLPQEGDADARARRDSNPQPSDPAAATPAEDQAVAA